MGQFIGSLPFLFPYVELDNIASKLDADRASTTGGISIWDINQMGDGFPTRSTAWQLAQTRIPLLACPDDQPYSKTNVNVIVLFQYLSGNAWMDTLTLANGTGYELGRTNYLGSGGLAGFVGIPAPNASDAQTMMWFNQNKGVFWNRSKIDYRDITDGSSHTVLFGEIMGGTVNLQSGEPPQNAGNNSYSWIGAGTMWMANGLSDEADWDYFSSYHPGIVNFCLVDGSVRNISTKVNLSVFQVLGCIAYRQGGSPSLPLTRPDVP